MNRTDVQIQTDMMTTATYMIETFRDESKAYFPEPPVDICIEYAITELAEALDASLRLNPRFKRNNHRNISVEDELMDALFMVTSAYIQIPLEDFKLSKCFTAHIVYTEPGSYIISEINDVSETYQYYEIDGFEGEKEITVKAWLGRNMIRIMQYVPDWQERLGKRLIALKNKHGVTSAV